MLGICGFDSVRNLNLARAIAENSDFHLVEVSNRTSPKLDELTKKKFASKSEKMSHMSATLEDIQTLYKSQGSKFITNLTPIDLLASVYADFNDSHITYWENDELLLLQIKCIDICNQYFSNMFLLQPPYIKEGRENKIRVNGYDEHINCLLFGILTGDSRLLCGKHSIPKHYDSLSSQMEAVNYGRLTYLHNYESEISEDEIQVVQH